MVPYVLTFDDVNLRMLEICFDMWHLIAYDSSFMAVVKC